MAEPAAAATMREAFQATAARCPQPVALRPLGRTAAITWEQYASRVRQIAGGLAGLGVGRGDTVALMMTNRAEYHLVDPAAFHLGAVPFSLYNTLASRKIGYVLADAGCRVVVCEQQFAARLLAVTGDTAVEHVVWSTATRMGPPRWPMWRPAVAWGRHPQLGRRGLREVIRPLAGLAIPRASCPQAAAGAPAAPVAPGARPWWPGPRGMIGQMSTTTSSCTTWNAS